jgi:hypothetical protein
MTAHPNCTAGHLCQQPSGRLCIEAGCDQPAGTLWGPYWCPDHDKARLDRINPQMEALMGRNQG